MYFKAGILVTWNCTYKITILFLLIYFRMVKYFAEILNSIEMTLENLDVSCVVNNLWQLLKENF